MKCSDCNKELTQMMNADTGETYFVCSGGCPNIVPFPQVFQSMADNITGKQLENIINWLVDIGYDVQYLGDGTFKKIYRERRDN